jgi:hypothetical protein
MQRASSGSVRFIWPEFSRQELIDRLRQGVASLNSDLPVRRAVLFGSWAKARATAYSDVDLPVIYAGPSREDAHSNGWSVAAIDPDPVQTRHHDDGASPWFATVKRI